MSERNRQRQHWGTKTAIALMLGLWLAVLGACDDLLEVDLPADLSDEVLTDPDNAETLANSTIALFECGYSTFAWGALGHEDVLESIAGIVSTVHRFRAVAPGGTCDASSEDDDWFDQISESRSRAVGLHDQLQNVWTVEEVPDRERLAAITALYAAANFDLFGEFFCDITFDESPLIPPDETLAMAEGWIDTALGHIASIGDFAMPHGIASSAETMAYGLRARIRWARGPDHWEGALEDAQRVPQGFVAWVTRENSPQRRNKVYLASTLAPVSSMLDVNDWWTGPENPVTGESWPSPIPFTGYLNLGVLEDGRAVREDGVPIRTTVETDAVQDTRVQHELKTVQGPQPLPVPSGKYTSPDDDIPLVNWEEIWLVRAEIEGGQAAIDLVNDLRDQHGLPRVRYADPANEEQIRYMIIEERRRELWLEGRYLSTKIQNTDLLWFPRGFGRTPRLAYNLGGGVRFAMPADEYTLNPNLTTADRGTGCSPDQAPTTFDF